MGWQPDLLGNGFEQLVLDLGADPDGEGAVCATLVRSTGTPDAERVVLYLHGFSDYFFHRELTDHLHGLGFAVYALDLRKSGRSRRPGQTAHYVSDLEAYDLDLDRAMDVIAEHHPGARMVVLAHSTGGLVAALWLARRRRPVAGLVLNSPWLDLQGSWLRRTLGTRLVELLARVRPYQVLRTRPGGYGRSLHVSTGGLWDFDLALKPLEGFPVTAGWLSAVRRGQRRLQRGLGLDLPVLVLHSDRSCLTPGYSPQTDRADAVLDVAQIARHSPAIGPDVSVIAVPGARHDVFLSLNQPKRVAYAMLDAWLSARGLAG